MVRLRNGFVFLLLALEGFMQRELRPTLYVQNKLTTPNSSFICLENCGAMPFTVSVSEPRNIAITEDDRVIWECFQTTLCTHSYQPTHRHRRLIAKIDNNLTMYLDIFVPDVAPVIEVYIQNHDVKANSSFVCRKRCDTIPVTITTSVATDIILSENDRVLLTCPDASQCVLTHNIIGKLSRIDVSVGSSYTAYFEIFDFDVALETKVYIQNHDVPPNSSYICYDNCQDISVLVITSVAENIILRKNGVLLICSGAIHCLLNYKGIGSLSRIDVNVGPGYTAYFDICVIAPVTTVFIQNHDIAPNSSYVCHANCEPIAVLVITTVASNITVVENDNVLVHCPDTTLCTYNYNGASQLATFDVSVSSGYTSRITIYVVGTWKRVAIIFITTTVIEGFILTICIYKAVSTR